MTLDLHPSALVALGFGLCLLSVLLLLASFIWISIGGHVARVITEAGKRAVSERLGDAQALRERPTPDDRSEHVPEP